MIKYILPLLVSVPVLANDCPVLTDNQKHVLEYSYQRGLPHDLGYTLAAIALQESSAGVNLFNPKTLDYGPYQGNHRTVCSQANRKTFEACQYELKLVMTSMKRASHHALETLQWWYNYHEKRGRAPYEHMIRSYVAGHSWASNDATVYWNKFKKNLKTVQQCVTVEYKQ